MSKPKTCAAVPIVRVPPRFGCPAPMTEADTTTPNISIKTKSKRSTDEFHLPVIGTSLARRAHFHARPLSPTDVVDIRGQPILSTDGEIVPPPQGGFTRLNA